MLYLIAVVLLFWTLNSGLETAHCVSAHRPDTVDVVLNLLRFFLTGSCFVWVCIQLFR